LRAEEVVTQLLASLFRVVEQSVLLIIRESCILIDLQEVSNFLKEEYSGKDRAEVLAAPLQEVVLCLKELGLLMDILVDLGKKLASRDFGPNENVFDS